MKEISMIIPVYNSEAYIGQCVQSLINQTCQNWKALLIDDGSTDYSLGVCEKLSRTDDRIKVYPQEHKGIAAVRNYGLDLATGEYIYFLDSDDAIHPLLFEEMIRQIDEYHVEMVFCNFIRVNNRQMDSAFAKASPHDERPQWQIGNGAESERWFPIDHNTALIRPCGMMSRNVIGPLRFEDILFMYFLFRKQVKAAYSPRRWYYFRIHPQSRSRCMDFLIEDVHIKITIRIRDRCFRCYPLYLPVNWAVKIVWSLREREGRNR